MSAIHNIISRLYYAAWVPRKHGGEFSRQVAWFNANQRKSQQELEGLRWDLLVKLLTQAVKNVPYYRNWFAQQQLDVQRLACSENFHRIPLLTKSDLNEKSTGLIAETADLRSMVRTGTSGSTGKPVHVFHDSFYQQHNAAMIYRNLHWTGWEPGCAIVKVWGRVPTKSWQAAMRERLTLWLNNTSVFSAYQMHPEQMLNWLGRLRQIHPAVVEGYTSALVGLVEFSDAHSIRLDALGVKAVISSAEMLYPWQRSLLENAFACQVFNRYGTVEASTIAHECAHGRLHLNEDWVYVEVTDDMGQPVPAGNLGQLVVSSYYSTGMPLIRYAVEDLGSISTSTERCSCGCTFRWLDRLEGRIQDLIILPGGGYVASQLFSRMIRQFDIRQFQVVQTTAERVEISLITGNSFLEQHKTGIRQSLQPYLPGVELVLNSVNALPLSPSGKHRYAISHVSNRSSFFAQLSNPGDPPS